MEKDIDRVAKNNETDIVIRIDDYGGKRGVTIREFVKSERYTGFTKAGTRIPADKFAVFKAAINAIDENDLVMSEEEKQATLSAPKAKSSAAKKPVKTAKAEPIEPTPSEDEDEVVEDEKTDIESVRGEIDE
jgi:hypothetical protein